MKKILSLLFIGLLLFGSFFRPPTTKAVDDMWYNSDMTVFFQKVYDSPPTEVFGERYTQAQVGWIMYSFPSFFIYRFGLKDIYLCYEAGDLSKCGQAFADFVKSLDPIRAIFSDSSPTKVSEKGWLAFFKDKPISGIGYVLRTGERINVIPTAYAQGVGYTAGDTLQPLWSTVRDVSYAILVIVIIVFAFAIMFKMKISAQAAITIQSAIPKVAVALILITFSYAIAGFMIDLMYVVLGLLSTILSVSGLSSMQPTDLFDKFINENIFTLSLVYFGGLAVASVYQIFSSGAFSLLFLLLLIAGIIGLVLNFFKVLTLIIKTYVAIIFGIAFAPIQIALGLVSNGSGFKSWMMGLLGNLAVYPTVAMVYFFALFMVAQGNASLPIPDWGFGVQDLIGNGTTWAPPLFNVGGRGVGFLFVLASYFVFTSIPKAGEIAKGIISSKMPNLDSGISTITDVTGQIEQLNAMRRKRIDEEWNTELDIAKALPENDENAINNKNRELTRLKEIGIEKARRRSLSDYGTGVLKKIFS